MIPLQRIRSRRRSKGGATVEMAVTAPILVVLMFGTIEIGWILLVRQSMYQAARAGARVLAVETSAVADAETEADRFLDRTKYPYVYTTEKAVGNPLVRMNITVKIDDVSLSGDPLSLFDNHTLTAEAVVRKEEPN